VAVPSGRSLGQEISSWVQTVGILIAAAWGGYTFIYKEVVLPNSAPVNISVDLQLKKIGQMGPNAAPLSEVSDDKTNGPQGIDKKKQLIGVEMRISAINPSPRDVYLLPSAWFAYGIIDRASDDLSNETAALILNARTGTYILRHAVPAEVSLVAVGSLLPDYGLRPNEKAVHTDIIYVPAGKYDRILVEGTLITASKRAKLTVQWKWIKDKDKEFLAPQLYRVGANNEQIELTKDEQDYYFREEGGIQLEYASGQISLWQ
jgi:hypothetical protein